LEKFDPWPKVELFQKKSKFPQDRTPDRGNLVKVNLEATFPRELFLYILGVIGKYLLEKA